MASRNSFYRPDFFGLHEVVPADLFHEHPADKLWMIFDPFILMAADALRRRYGSMEVNTWYWGGEYQFRGWRPPACSIGAEFSMHRFGKALDLDPQQVSAEEIRADMRRWPQYEIFKYISRVEESTSWLHIDRANVSANDGIVFFKP